MAVDNSKLNYSSDWDIDQLVASDTAAVGSGTIAIYTIPSSSVPIPVVEVQFRPTGSSLWFQEGKYATAGTFASSSAFYSYISGNQVFIHTSTTGTARYYVWADKVNY